MFESNRRGLRQAAVLFLLLGTTALVAHARSLPEPAKPVLPPPSQGAARIDVAFVLDTTGSMAGLIEGAKRKIWSIASRLANGQPQPEIRMSLVAYRDRGDEYVTKRFELTDDIDAVYGQLQGLQAAGGGDTPESVNQALYEAVSALAWRADPDVYRVIFLVGDAPPHMDYANETRYPEIAKLARQRGIVINTVQAGALDGTAAIWQAIASSGGGQYASIAQDGAMAAETTPHDGELARLNRELADTVISWGGEAEQAEIRGKLREAAAAAPGVAAARLSYLERKGGRVNLGSKDLVDAVKEDAVDAAALPSSVLPEEMRDLDGDERRDYVQRKLEKRKEIQAEVGRLVTEREGYLKEQRARTGKSNAFDDKVFETIRSQAADKGIHYE